MKKLIISILCAVATAAFGQIAPPVFQNEVVTVSELTTKIFTFDPTSSTAGVMICFTSDGSMPAVINGKVTNGHSWGNGQPVKVPVYIGKTSVVNALAFTKTAVSSISQLVCSNPYLYTPPALPLSSTIWQRWTDHRPIGQLIVAGANRGVVVPQPAPEIPTPQTSAPYYSDWNKWNIPNVDTTTAAGLQSFQAKEIAYWQQTINDVKAVNGQGIICWDIEGEGHEMLIYVGHPTFLAWAAPEMNVFADQLFSMVRQAGLRTGVCLRATHIAVDANGVPLPETAQQYYTTYAEALSDLDTEMTYEQKRWGCTLFYVDSNGDGGQFLGQGEPAGIEEAQLFHDLAALHPDCLICPEFWFDNGAHGPTDSYTLQTAPYREARGNILAIPSAVTAYPGSFDLECISDAAAKIAAGYPAFLTGLRNGNILLWRAWFPSKEQGDVIQYMKDAAATPKSKGSTR